ncbi:hypothetical protein AABL83_17760, partial [Myroides odoratimimus]
SIGKGAITTDKLADGAVTTEKIEAGKDGQVLVTVIEKDAEGKDVPTTKWVSKVDATTNTLAKKDGTNGNTIVSTVNGVPAEIALVDKVENKVNGTTITTVVNGVESTSVDLTSAIEAGQKTTSVKNGSDKVTVVTTGVGTKGKNTEYTVDVDEAKLSLQNIGGQVTNNQIQGGKEGDVLVTVKEGEKMITKWITKADATTNKLGVVGNELVSTVNGVEGRTDLTDKISNEMLQGASVTSDKLSAGKGDDNRVAVADKEGNVTYKTQKEIIEGNTSNKLELKGNSLTSTVNGTSSTVTLTDANIVSSKGITGTGITVTGGANATLKDVTLAITPGKENQVMVTSKEGNATWVDQNALTNITLGGDVTGNADNTTISKLQGKDLVTTNVAEGNVLVFEGGKWITKTPTVDASNVGKGKALSSTENTITISANGATSLLKDVQIDVADNAITSAKIKDGAVTTNKITGGDNGQVLTTTVSTEGKKIVEWKTPTVNTTDITGKGNLKSENALLTVDKGDGVVLQNVSLTVNEGNFNISNMKGDLTVNRIEGGKPNQVLVTEGNKVTWVDNKTFVQANQEKVVVKPADGKTTGTNSNVIVTPGTNPTTGEKEYTVDVKAAMPKVFYMPPVMFDTSKKHNELQTRNLYDEYVAMFGGTGAVVDTPISGDRPPMVQSDASATIPVYKKEDLNFFVPYYDPAVFSDVKVDANGVLTYKVIKKAKYGAFMTVVFVVK